MRSFKTAFKSWLYPMRLAAGKFAVSVEAQQYSSIIYKAAQIISAEQVQGDYLEFGVFRGASFARAFELIRQVYQERSLDRSGLHSPVYRAQVAQAWNQMRFFAFDSFQGLPVPTGIDASSIDFVEHQFASGLDDFVKNLKAKAVDMDKVVIVPGWFQDTCHQETITQYGMTKAAIVNIDCDLYESARVVLRFIESLLTEGTILIFDDWYTFRGNPNLGEQRAFREWTATLTDWIFTEYQREGPWRNSFIANRRVYED